MMTLDEYHDQWAKHNAAETDELRRDSRIMRAMLSIMPGNSVVVVDKPINHVAAGRHAKQVGHHDLPLVLNGGGMKDVEKQAIIGCAKLFDGNWAAVSRKMKISRTSLIRKRRRLGLMKYSVKSITGVFLALLTFGCSTPTIKPTPVDSPLTVEPFNPEVPVRRQVNIHPGTRFSQQPQASVAPAAVPSVPPNTNVLAIWNYRSDESLMVYHSSTNLKNWTYRGYTTNTSVKLPSNKPMEFFHFMPVKKGGTFHYGSGYVWAPR